METTRTKIAQHYTWRTLDTISYQTGLLCQRAGVSYRGRVTPDELAEVEAATICRTRGDLAPPDWTDERAESYGALLTALLVFLALAVLGLLCAPFLLCVYVWAGRQSK